MLSEIEIAGNTPAAIILEQADYDRLRGEIARSDMGSIHLVAPHDSMKRTLFGVPLQLTSELSIDNINGHAAARMPALGDRLFVGWELCNTPLTSVVLALVPPTKREGSIVKAYFLRRRDPIALRA